MAQFDVYSTSVENIISWIKSGEVAIPEIQRPFVWDATKVRDLMDSLYKGFPVGYIIVWKNPDVRLKDGSISTGKKILIDGQQRITAMQAAIAGQMVTDASYKKRNPSGLHSIRLKRSSKSATLPSKRIRGGFLTYPGSLTSPLILGHLLANIARRTDSSDRNPASTIL